MKKYFIDGDGGNQLFDTLDDVKSHVEMMCDSDKESYNGMSVLREDDESFIRTIEVKKGKVVLKKTILSSNYDR